MLERPKPPVVDDQTEESNAGSDDEVNVKDHVVTSADVLSRGVEESGEPATLGVEDAVAASENVVKQSMSGIS